MAEYILVSEDEREEPMEIPVEHDGTLLLSTLAAQFPGSCGLRFRNPESGSFRGVRVQEGRLYPPDADEGWANVPFVAVFPKMERSDASGENKRKGDETGDIPIPKTKKLDIMTKCSDLIVLGLDYNTTEDIMKKYFSQFGDVILCEIKKRQDTGKSRGFGFVKFTDYSVQRMVLGQKHEIDGRKCDVKIPNSKENDDLNRRVFVGRVPDSMNADDLRNYFKQYGDITEVFIPKPYRPFAFVTFDDPMVAHSLCGHDHIVNETSLLVRSAAPRQDCDYEDDVLKTNISDQHTNSSSESAHGCSDKPYTDLWKSCSVVLRKLNKDDLLDFRDSLSPSRRSRLRNPTLKEDAKRNIKHSFVLQRHRLQSLRTMTKYNPNDVKIKPCSVVLCKLLGEEIQRRNDELSVDSYDISSRIVTKPCSVVLSKLLCKELQEHTVRPCYVNLTDCLLQTHRALLARHGDPIQDSDIHDTPCNDNTPIASIIDNLIPPTHYDISIEDSSDYRSSDFVGHGITVGDVISLNEDDSSPIIEEHYLDFIAHNVRDVHINLNDCFRSPES